MNILYIARRELGAIFGSAMGWMIMAGFLAISGMFWSALMDNYVRQSVQSVMDPRGASGMNLTDYLLLPFFGNMTVILLMVAPALSMRLFSEELRNRTIDLLLTSPVSTFDIVMGKYLGAMAYVAILLLCTAHYPGSLTWWGTPDPGVVAGCYAGAFLFTATIMAMGMFFSSMTAHQVVAMMFTFAASLGLYVSSWLSEDPDGWLAKISISEHLTGLMGGELKLSDLVFYFAFITVSLFATHQRVESWRWR
jgi:ABC-2 type transport system permease protein